MTLYRVKRVNLYEIEAGSAREAVDLVGEGDVRAELVDEWTDDAVEVERRGSWFALHEAEAEG